MTRLAPLFAYLPWHARDAIWRALAPVIIAAASIGLPIWSFSASSERGEAAMQQLFLTIYSSGLTLSMTLGAIIFMNQVVALDREKQHYRFLLAHPVSAWEFYLQRFVVGLVLYVAAMAVIPAVFSLAVVDVPVWATVQAAAVQGLVVGALGFLCGTLFAKDGLALIGVYLVSTILHDVHRAGQLASWLKPVLSALPPIGQASGIRSALLTESPVVTGDLAHVLLYAAGMLVLSLFLVKRLPLAR